MGGLGLVLYFLDGADGLEKMSPWDGKYPLCFFFFDDFPPCLCLDFFS